MPKIYDNIQNIFADGLTDHLSTATRVDYCVGYFNLRGWRTVCAGIDKLPGETIREKDGEAARYCRLLVGMTKTSKELLLEEFANTEDLMIDNEKANTCRKRLAVEFAEQLTIGAPTEGDELVLKKLLE